MGIEILEKPVTRTELADKAREIFGEMLKAVVDVEQQVIAIGPELHADAQTFLIEKAGSSGMHTWGINLYPGDAGEGFIEYDSLVNLKPAIGNRTRDVENPETREKIRAIVQKFVTDF